PPDEVSTVDWNLRWKARTQPRWAPASTCVQPPWRESTFTGASAGRGAIVLASIAGRSFRSVARLVDAASWASASPASDSRASRSGRRRRAVMAPIIGRSGATFNADRSMDEDGRQPQEQAHARDVRRRGDDDARGGGRI